VATRHALEAGIHEERVQGPSDQRVAPGACLQVDQALDGFPRVGALRMEIRRAVVAFDDREGAATLEDALEARKRPAWRCEMLEHEADEYVVEALRGER
jgi:hypothetical protein